MTAIVQQPDSSELVHQILWRALELLNLSGEFMDDSYQAIPELWSEFLQHDSIRLITRFLTQRLAEQSDSYTIDALAESVAREYGEFLSNACKNQSVKCLSLGKRTQRARPLSSTYQSMTDASTVRIPLDWIPEPEQSEIRRYLDLLKTMMGCYAETINSQLIKLCGKEVPLDAESMFELVDFFSHSKCLHILDPQHALAEVVDYFLREPTGNDAFEPISRIFLSDSIAFLLGWNRDFPSVGYEGFYIVKDSSSCNACPQCEVVTILVYIFSIARLSCGRVIWSPNEISEFCLFRLPLPDYVGYLNLSNHVLVNAPLMPMYHAVTSINLLPCLSPTAVKHLYARIKSLPLPRHLGVYTFCSLASQTVAEQVREESEIPVESYLGSDYYKFNLRRGELQDLLEKWNEIAPPEWRYSASSNFCRDLRKAWRVMNVADRRDAP
jgi:hypothetical protein